VLVPGIQGRPEYHAPAIEALSRHFDVVTLPLCGESGCPVRDASSDFDTYAALIEKALDARNTDRAVVCGVSFGGRIALRFAAQHPDRTTALVLASVPGPGWHLRKRHEVYARMPRLFGALFLAESPFRLRREIVRALPAWRDRRRFLMWQVRTLATAPLSLTRMAARAKLMSEVDAVADCAHVKSPTLLITGDESLDQVVPIEASRRYLELIRDIEYATVRDTGHLGSNTHADVFASIVADFVERQTTRGARASA